MPLVLFRVPLLSTLIGFATVAGYVTLTVASVYGALFGANH